MTNAETAVNLLVTGRVQGVGLRAAIKERALELNLRGWVRNTSNGAVQVHAEGDQKAVMQLVNDVQAGLAASDVQSCFTVKSTVLGYSGFNMKGPRKGEQEGIALNEKKRLGNSFGAIRTITQVLVENCETSLPHLEKAEASRFIEVVPDGFLSEWLAKRYYSSDNAAGCSFSSSLWKQTRFRNELSREVAIGNEMLLNAKHAGYQFAENLGIRRAKVLQKDVSLNDIRFQKNTVVKPTSGTASTGVYLVFDTDRQKSISTREEFNSPESIRDSMRQLLEKGLVKKDSWIIEEMVVGADGQPAHDLKFYAFYGATPLVLQVNRNDKPVRYCWWDQNGERVQTGKYARTLFDGEPFPKNYFDLAGRVSQSIPAPFLRIDFLSSSDGMVFSEFTPRPGLFNEFDSQTDAMLGKQFVNAQARLFKDIYLGKKFPEFDALFESERLRKQKKK